MLPIPATNRWSMRSGFSWAWRLSEECSEAGPAHHVVDRVESEVRELGDRLFEIVRPGHEELAEGAGVHETELAGLGEGDHDVGVLGHRLFGRLDPEELAAHPEVDDEHVLFRRRDR